MIKTETLGMLNIAKINPVLTSSEDVKNYTFVTDSGVLYLVANTATGDDAYKDDITFKAGTLLNGFQVDAWAGQKLVIDEKHIDISAALKVGNVLVVNSDGRLEYAASAPAKGVYFIVTDLGVSLTGKAIKARVCVA